MENIQKREDNLFERISELIEQARKRVVTAVNVAEVYTKYSVGKYIVEDEQQGEYRAQYGKQVLQNLSIKLTERFGDGWTVDTLKRCRYFYNVYCLEEKRETLLPNSQIVRNESVTNLTFSLSWSHYLILMRIENADARRFYEIECSQQQWSVRQLSRQVGSSLYERIALSRNKDEVMKLASEGQTIEKPTIGILLCEEKNDALVELTLPKDANIYASEYQLYLPDKAVLQRKLKEWIDEFEDQQ